MPDLRQIPPGLQRRQLLEIIEQSQEKAWRKLRDAGVPEVQALAVMPRIRAYCMFAFNGYDQAILAIEEVVAKEGRSAAHQRLINDKAAFLLRSIEAGIAEILAAAIRQAIRAGQQPQSQDVIPMPYLPSPPAWQTFLVTTIKLLVWLIGLPASLLLTWQFTGGDVWVWSGPVVLFVLWLLVRFSWWGLLFPITALGAALYLSL
jgi:hypothetical protein